MAPTAVEVYRGNDQPCEKKMLPDAAASVILNEKDAKDKIANRQKVLDGVQGARHCPECTGEINMHNDTNGPLLLVSYDSRDDAFPYPPPGVIPPRESIEFECRDTFGSGVAYRGKHEIKNYKYDWVVAWANKPDQEDKTLIRERVLTLLHEPRKYDKKEWEKIFAELDARRSTTSSAEYRDFRATATIICANGKYMVKAALHQIDKPARP